MAAAFDYDAFVSYSRDQVDRDVAVRLQDELQRFNTPWFRPRARTLRVYRDQTNLPLSPDLWGALEGAMSSSRWLVLVASPRSAHSQGVRRELDWWRGQRGPANICIAVVDGELRWDQAANDFDWTTTTALSREVLGQTFTREPAWVDLRPVTHGGGARRRGPLRPFTRSLADPRLQDAAASLIAEIKDVPKDTLIGQHLRRSRQTRRAVTSALLILALLLAASVTAGLIARSQRDQATHQATISEAGQLAAISESLTGSNMDLAELFAAEAYHIYPDAQTRAALFNAVTADPHLVRYLPATGSVSAVATSLGGNTAVAGTVGGDVLRWSLTDFQRAVVARLPGSISGVAASANGSTIAAIDDSAAVTWVLGESARPVRLPRKWAPLAVGVSPSGQYIALSVQSPDDDYYLIVVDERTGRSVMTPDGRDSNLCFDGENQLVTFGGNGTWERFAIPSLRKAAASSAELGVLAYQPVISATGEFIAATYGGPPTQVWSTLSAPTPARSPPFGAQESGVAPEALAISADGKMVADADNGTIYVSNVTPYKDALSDSKLQPLTGNSTISQNELTFIGESHSELLSASGSTVILWNLNQYSRIATEASVDVPQGCPPCSGPGIYASPGADDAIVTTGYGDAAGTAMLVSLPPASGHLWYLHSAPDVTYGPVVWSPDGREFSILTPSDGGGEVWSVAGKPEFLRYWTTPSGTGLPDTGNDIPVSAVPAAGGKKVIEVDVAGNIIVRNSATGAVERQVAGPVRPDSAHVYSPYLTAVDAAAKYAAVVVYVPSITSYSTYVDVVDIGTGAITRIPGGTANGIAYDGELLLIQRANGTLEVRSADGQRLIRSFAGDVNALSGPAVNGAGLAVEVNSDGTAPVFDIASGQQIGVITLPAGPRNVSTSVAFTPDGKDLISATESSYEPSGTGQVTEWGFTPGLWVEAACTSAGHVLTAEEWQQYIGAGGPGMPNQMACQS